MMINVNLKLEQGVRIILGLSRTQLLSWLFGYQNVHSMHMKGRLYM